MLIGTSEGTHDMKANTRLHAPHRTSHPRAFFLLMFRWERPTYLPSVSCELVCVCVSLVRVVIICPASTHTALVSRSPSLTVLHLSTYLPNRLSEQANLDSKLKVEVCVRTGTKFVSEQGLGTPQRESVALALGRTCCVLSPSVARRETSRQEEGRSGATGNVRAPEL